MQAHRVIHWQPTLWVYWQPEGKDEHAHWLASGFLLELVTDTFVVTQPDNQDMTNVRAKYGLP